MVRANPHYLQLVFNELDPRGTIKAALDDHAKRHIGPSILSYVNPYTAVYLVPWMPDSAGLHIYSRRAGPSTFLEPACLGVISVL